MPRFDGTGPFGGYGPRTGWGLGPCCFRGRRTFSAKEQSLLLEEEEKALEEELVAVRKEISELKGQEK